MKHPSRRSRTRVDWGTGAPRPGYRDTTRRHFVRTSGWSAGGSAGGAADGLWTDNRCGSRKDVEDTRERKTKEKERHYLWKHMMRGGDYVRGGESWGGSWDRTGRSAKIDFDWTALQMVWGDSESWAGLSRVWLHYILYPLYRLFLFVSLVSAFIGRLLSHTHTHRKAC